MCIKHSPCLVTRKDTVAVVQFRFGEENTANLKRSVAAFLLSWCGLLAEQRLGIERRGDVRV